MANLRSALWRLRPYAGQVLDVHPDGLAIAPHVRVDLHRLTAWALGVISGSGEADDAHTRELVAAGALLQDWDEDWLLLQRERFHQLRLHALERICERLTQAGRYGLVVEAGLAAVVAEPLRESAQRLNRTDFDGDSTAWRKMESCQITAVVCSSAGTRQSSVSGPSGWFSRRRASRASGSG
jgi:DNA-binding SARP family transcriptional activator